MSMLSYEVFIEINMARQRPYENDRGTQQWIKTI
jgi:hypothetical protein